MLKEVNKTWNCWKITDYLLFTATHSFKSSPSGSMTAMRRFPLPSVASACFNSSYWCDPSGIFFLGLNVLAERFPLRVTKTPNRRQTVINEGEATCDDKPLCVQPQWTKQACEEGKVIRLMKKCCCCWLMGLAEARVGLMRTVCLSVSVMSNEASRNGPAFNSTHSLPN